MEITIKKLTMRNFKGVLGERVVEFSPTVTKVYGANRTGKTTIADAFRWCLFGKNTEGKADFGIKTKDAQGNVIPELEHEVTVLLDVDGQETTITRTFVEKWSKPRGVAEKQLTGHTTTYTVNGQLYTQRDFNEYINSLCSESLFMAITSPTYFVSLKADQQRSILTEMVGEVSTVSVASGNKEFQALLQVMGEQDIEKFRQHLSYQMKEIKAELERIPVRISEQQNDIANITPAEPVDWKQVECDILATKSAIERIQQAIADTVADHNKAQAEAQAKQQEARQQVYAQIADLQKQQLEISNRYQYNNNKVVAERERIQAEFKEKCMQVLTSVQQLTRELDGTKNEITAVGVVLGTIANAKEDFKQRWAAVEAEQLVFNESQFICPCCKRPLEAEDAEAKKAEMLANFNANKANKLDAMEAEAAQLVEREKQQQARLQELQTKQAEQQTKLQAAQAKRAEIDALAETDKAPVITPVDELLANDAQYQQLTAQMAELRKQLDAIPATATTDTQAAVQGLQADQQQLLEKLNQLNALAQVGTTIANKRKRISELEKQEQQLNVQLTQLEGQDYTAEQLLQRTIEELESKVNALFSFVAFTMFDHKINGSLKPVCECTVGGVPYSDLNNAARINAGLDIINAMCKHKGIYAPCFIDNAESINELLPMASQRVDLIVSTDKELKIETE